MATPQDDRALATQQRWIECYNDSGSTLAAHSVVEVVESTRTGTRTILTVDVGQSDSPDNSVVIGPFPIADEAYGLCTMDVPVYAKIDHEPSNGDIVGLETGGTELTYGMSGYIVLGDYHDDLVRVARGCDCGGCRIVYDYFDRADSGTVSGWDERSGVWSIASEELAEAGNSGALIVNDTYHEELSFYVRVLPGGTDIVPDRVYRVVANYLNDTAFYHANYTYDSVAEEITIEIYKSGVLVIDQTWTDIDSADIEHGGFSMCLQDGYVSATMTSLDVSGSWRVEKYDSVSMIGSGYKHGLGNGTSDAITYDDYQVEETYETDVDCPLCAPRCCGKCDDWEWDRTSGFWFGDLCLTITSVECPGIDGEATLTYMSIPPGVEECVEHEKYWSGTISGGDLDGNTVWMHCNCDNAVETPGTMDYRISLEGAVGALCGVNSPSGGPDSATCEPLSLTWNTTTYNESVSEEDPCYTWCDDGEDVVITVECCGLASPRSSAEKAVSKPNGTVQSKSLKAKVSRYAIAVKRWIASGRPKRSDDEVASIVGICESCDKFDKSRCALCGCHVNKSRYGMRNKARMKTESCPLGKW